MAKKGEGLEKKFGGGVKNIRYLFFVLCALDTRKECLWVSGYFKFYM